MVDQLRPIRLTGDASACFAEALFRPTQETVERNNKVIGTIDDEIALNEYDDGFSADVAGLDLSFLESMPSSNNIELGLTMKVFTEKVFVSFIDAGKSISSVFVELKAQHEETVSSVFLSCAA